MSRKRLIILATASSVILVIALFVARTVIFKAAEDPAPSVVLGTLRVVVQEEDSTNTYINSSGIIQISGDCVGAANPVSQGGNISLSLSRGAATCSLTSLDGSRSLIEEISFSSSQNNEWVSLPLTGKNSREPLYLNEPTLLLAKISKSGEITLTRH